MAVLFVLLISILLTSFYIGRKKSEEGLVTIAVSCSEQDSIMKYLVAFVGEMSSLKNFCSLESTDYNRAMEMLANGEADIVIDVPPDFYSKAESMQDVSLRLYVPKGAVLAKSKLLALFDSVEMMMITTEAAIYSMYDVIEIYDISMGISEMENVLFDDIIRQFMNRGALFRVDSVSPFGDFGPLQFYLITIVQVVTLLFGLFFMQMYSAENMQLEKLLARNIYGRIGMSFVHIISMALPISCVWIVSAFVYNRVCLIMRNYDGCISTAAYASILLYALLVAVYIHLCAALLGGSEQGGTIYCLVSLMIIVLSGTVIPTVFIPDIFRKLTVYNPVYMWQSVLLNGFWGRGTGSESAFLLLITTVIMAAGAILLYCRRLENNV